MPVCCGLRPASQPGERSEPPYGQTRLLFATPVLPSLHPEDPHRFYDSASLYLYALPAFGTRRFAGLLRLQERPYALEGLESSLPEVARCPHAPLAWYENVGDHTEQRASASPLLTHLSTSPAATRPRSSPPPQRDAPGRRGEGCSFGSCQPLQATRPPSWTGPRSASQRAGGERRRRSPRRSSVCRAWRP